MTAERPAGPRALSERPERASGRGRRAEGREEPTPEQRALQHLWEEYKATGSQNTRDKLILHYAPLVKYVAGRVSAGLPSSVDPADLASYGVFGLIDAIEKFEPGRGYKFETYAIRRIRGAIIDELRAIDWVPRSLRLKAREVERSISRLEAELKRVPTDAEIARDLGMELSDLRSLYNQLSFASLVALDELISESTDGRDGVSLADTLEDTASENPVAILESVETKRFLARAINKLPDREKIVITLYYYEGLTLGEIGQVIGVSESRACQMHTKAVLQLRAQMLEEQED
ncbi:MAG: RNA polymerase sigma factor WhiG [Candidatus Methylomirabilales bacterium]